MIYNNEKSPLEEHPPAELPLQTSPPAYETGPSFATPGPSSRSAYAQPVPGESPEKDSEGAPPGFSRAPPPNLAPPSFGPLYLEPSVRNSLSKGFQLAPPPCRLQPHPFVTYDVTEADWKRFILELQEVSKLTKKESMLVYKIPVLSMLPIIAPMLHHAIVAYVKNKKPLTAASLIDTWNRHFFHLRYLDVALYKGPERVSSTSDVQIPPNASTSVYLGKKGGSSSTDPADPSLNPKNHFRLYVFPLPAA